MLKIRIAEDQDFNQDVVDFLKTFAHVDIQGCVQEEIPRILKEYDVFWFRLGFRIGEHEITKDSRCSILATPVTGLDHINEITCKENDITIVSLRGEREFLKEVRATAELTIALTLDLLRHTAAAQIDTLNGRWRRDLFRGNEIFQKNVGIVGYGRLGAITAGFFDALGANVRYTDVNEVSANPNHKAVKSLEELIEQSDIVSLHVNYNKETHHLLDENAFNHFTGRQYLINTSRGGIISEAALLGALKDGRLKGAALDVVNDEHRFNSSNPLLQYAKTHGNLILTPHIGGNTYESFSKTEWFIAKKIKSVLNV